MRLRLVAATVISLALCVNDASAAQFGRRLPKAPKAPPDSCAALREPFKKVKNAATTQAVIGAGLGALTGLLAAKVSNANKEETTKMVLVGAGLGAMAGYFNARRQQGETAAQLQASVASDFAPRMAIYSKVAENLADLGNCRRAQVFAIQQDYETQAATLEESRTRLDQVQQWISQDDQLVSEVAKTQSQRVANYAQAYGLASGMSEDQVAAPEQAISSLGEAQIGRYEDTVQVDSVDARGASAGLRAMRLRYAKPAGGARMRAAANATSAQVTIIPRNGAVEIVKAGEGALAWSEVRWNGQAGFVRNDLLASEPSTGPVKPPPPAPPVKRTKPTTVSIRPSTRPASVAPIEQVRVAVATQRTMEHTRLTDKAATGAALAEANALLGRV